MAPPVKTKPFFGEGKGECKFASISFPFANFYEIWSRKMTKPTPYAPVPIGAKCEGGEKRRDQHPMQRAACQNPAIGLFYLQRRGIRYQVENVPLCDDCAKLLAQGPYWNVTRYGAPDTLDAA